MEESILKSIKKNLGLAEDYDVFDEDVITFINSALGTLTQVGIGPAQGFLVTGDAETWENLLGADQRFGPVKSFVTLHTRLAFDPPGTSFHISAIQEQLREMLWRLEIAANPAPPVTVDLPPGDVLILDGGSA